MSAIILQHADMTRALTRIAHEILEGNRGTSKLVLLGIPTRGVALAHRIADALTSIEGGVPVPVGSLDVTMYRDDLMTKPMRASASTDIPVDIDGKTVVLIDDVLFSGRTVRAALDALTSLGRPETVRLAVLIDRGHRELPIRADYVGKNVPSARTERINVKVSEIDGEDLVSIAERTQVGESA